ncbi:MAG TPA: S8 family serine peptidase [Pyrinomonadaceae bacterium]|jgi:Tol biopolymer transport system component/subtilisin family serine protease
MSALTAARLVGALSLSLLLCAIFLPHISAGSGRPAPSYRLLAATRDKSNQEGAEFVPGEILVRFADEAVAKNHRQMMTVRQQGGRDINVAFERLTEASLVEGLRLARVQPAETGAALVALRARADVLYAEPNYIWRKEVVPNDPRYREQHNLKGSFLDGCCTRDIHAEEAWAITTGSRQVVVGVIDEGIDISHPDLRDNIWSNSLESGGALGVDDDNNGFIDDAHGYDFAHNDATVYDGASGDNETDAHGTHVAGIIGASGNNGVGIAGVNWQVRLMSLKVIGADGSGTTANFIRAYQYAKMMRETWESSGGTRGANIRVLNNSYGGRGFSQAALDAIRALDASGILFAAAAGNSAKNDDWYPHYPAGYDAPNVIAVAATDQGDNLSNFSNYGVRSVQMGAPGSSILSTTPHNTYSSFSGTSMAAPHVAGAAALVCAAQPNITVARLRDALVINSDLVIGLKGKTYAGRLNAHRTLQAATENDSTPPAPINDLRVSYQSGQSLAISFTMPGDDGMNGTATLLERFFTDAATGARFPLGAQGVGGAGQPTTIGASIPYRHTAGTLTLNVYDNAGNKSTASVAVSSSERDAYPYQITQSTTGALTTGGTRLSLNGDDRYFVNLALPFSFRFFDQLVSSVTISTNGALYFTDQPPVKPASQQNPFEGGNDAESSRAALNGYRMLAGLWDDLRIDRRPGDGIYIVTPDNDRVIYRWQAVTFDTPLSETTTRGEHPVSFEIELRRDNTIQVRYGEGNTNLFPVVGISGGEPEAFVVDSHTSESSLRSLTNAPAVTFTRLDPTPTPTPTLTPTPTPTPFPTPAPDPRGSIAYVSRNSDVNIFLTNADGSVRLPITNHTASDDQPTWSPDGKKIAFVSSRDGANPLEIFVMNADGTDVKKLTNNSNSGAFNQQPKWSPDGTKIAFLTNRDGNPEIYVMATDGWSQRRLTNTPLPFQESSPTWSPDGTKIAFTRLGDIYVMDADGGTNERRLTNLGYAFEVAWSPDGSRMAFSNGSDIFVMNADGSGVTNITNDGRGNASPAWSPDGTLIAHTSQRTPPLDIYVMKADGSEPRRLTTSSDFDASPAWQPVPGVVAAKPRTIQFSAANYRVAENNGRATITVTRLGDITGAADVQYATLDNPAAVRCDDQTAMPGVAFARCDYATSVDSLHFAPGEAAKTLSIPVIDDAHDEVDETLQIRLSTASGGVLSAQSVATITITDNDSAAIQPNPIDASTFFVRQHYLDFLSREPEVNEPWSGVLARCPNVNNRDPRSPSAECDRNLVSRSFFQSPEFQLKGFYVYLFYKVAHGRLPSYAEIIADMRGVTGETEAEVYAKRTAFSDNFTERPEFKNTYEAMTQQTYVSTLLGRYNLTTITTTDPQNPDTGQKVTLTADGLTSQLAAGTLTRAQVLRAVVQSDEVNGAEYNGAFVAMQYFGYLRRAPDQSGYDGWLNYLNAHPGDFRTMVNGFFNSVEYRLRFGQP